MENHHFGVDCALSLPDRPNIICFHKMTGADATSVKYVWFFAGCEHHTLSINSLLHILVAVG